MHKFKKSLGQNFLRDIDFVESVVSDLGLCSTDTVIEVGAGEGILTRALSKHVKKVVSFEVDKSLADSLEGLDIRFEDALEAEIDVGVYKVVANVPYYITTPLLFKFVNDPNCKEVCILVQKEVADRLVAKVGTKDYGALTVAVQAWGDVKKIRDVPRYLFTPQPNVDSSFIQIHKRSDCLPSPWLLKGMFSFRRKTVQNGLMMLFKRSREDVQRLLEGLGVDGLKRPENLTVSEYIGLSQVITREWMGNAE